MLILAFDTTNEHGGVGLFRDADCLACVANEGPANYSVTLFLMVDRLLAPLKLALRDVELFAVANGPGSFTGIRIGVAAAQGWAMAFRRPVRGVSVLEAMVDEARPETDLAVPILDARRGEFFLGLYRRTLRPALHHTQQGPVAVDTGLFTSQGEGMVMKTNALGPFFEQLASGKRAGGIVTCLGREVEPLVQAVRPSLPTTVGWQSVPGPLMGAIARLALGAHRRGRPQPPAELHATYIRWSDAELHLQKVEKQSQEHER